MPTPIGDAYVEVRADTRDFSRDVDRGVTKATQTATRSMGGLEKNVRAVGTAARLAIGGLAVGALGKVIDLANESVQAYSDLNESINAVNVSFGTNADEIQELGESAARNLGLSNAEFNSLAVSVSAFVDKIAQGLGQDVPGTLDTLTTRIADFASVMNLDVADAFEKFRSGLAGESEPLRQFGIDVSAATVEQVALKAGLIATGEEMTEAEKVTGRYLTIMEQTEKVAGDFAATSDELANSQRIVNAEMENAKAAAGEALVPMAEFWAQAELLGAKSLGTLGVIMQRLTGSMTDAEAVAARFAIATGQQADSAHAAASIVKFYQTSFEELLPVLDLSASEIDRLRDADDEFFESLGFTQDQLENVRAELETAYQNALPSTAEAMVLLRGTVDDATEATEGLGDEVKTTAQLLDEQHDAVRANIDPIFALRDATQEEAEAQAAVNAAIAEFGSGSAEHLDAIAGLSEAALDLSEAEDRVKVNTNLTRDAFIEQQTQLGLTRAEAVLLADELELLNSFKFDPKTIVIRTRGGGVTTNTADVRDLFRADGGPVTAGMPYIVGEDGPEWFFPKVSGDIVPNQNISGGPITIDIGGIHFTGVVDESTARRVSQQVAEAVVQRLARARQVR